LTRLHKCQFGIQNLNQLNDLIVKNWSNGPCFGCEAFVKTKFFYDFEDVEANFLNDIEICYLKTK
jgi:hypothetical protein